MGVEPTTFQTAATDNDKGWRLYRNDQGDHGSGGYMYDGKVRSREGSGGYDMCDCEVRSGEGSGDMICVTVR